MDDVRFQTFHVHLDLYDTESGHVQVVNTIIISYISTSLTNSGWFEVANMVGEQNSLDKVIIAAEVQEFHRYPSHLQEQFTQK